jgi:preprotein translocase subunit SecY
MLKAVQNIFRIPELRRRLLVTAALLIVYRIGRYLTLPGVDDEVVRRVTQPDSQQSGLGEMLGMVSMITGGALQQCTIFALGIMPYITASIVFSLLVKVVPVLEALSKEGESGRKKISQYTRYATVLLCIVQSSIVLRWIYEMGQGGEHLVDPQVAGSFGFIVTTVLTLTTGTIFLMWIGEQITEFGIGNGTSLIIMAGIIEEFPGAIYNLIKGIQSRDANIPLEVIRFCVFLALFVAIILAVVVIQRAQRRIPIQQAKHTRGRRVYGGQRHYMPIPVNAAGVMPVIFAQSLIVLPSALLSSLLGVTFLSNYFSSHDGFWYITVEIALIMAFTYFWNALTFNPTELANNMKEYGSFIPGIRPGKRTADYIDEILNRISLVGAVFLVTITVLPLLLQVVFGLDQVLTSRFLGGTGILIVVGVALDIVQKVESHLLMRHYEGFMKGGRIRGRRT